MPQLARSCGSYRHGGDDRLSLDSEGANRGRSIGEDDPVRCVQLLTFLVVSVWTLGALAIDQHVGHRGQALIGLVTVCVLAGLLALHPRRIRAQTLVVVAIATVGEVIGSLIWGLYVYRLDNLPAFVPPGHGLVYLGGLSLAALLERRSDALLIAAGAVAAVWGIAGLTVLPATDVSGTMGCVFLLAVLLWTRRPIYAGVFMVVAGLELYGTAIGTWTWQPVVPGLGIPQGNPPSGVASGYVVFDVVALTVVGWLVARQARRARRSSAPTTAPALISSRDASTLPQTSQSRNPRALPASST